MSSPYKFNNLCLNPYCNTHCGKNHFLLTFHPMMLNQFMIYNQQQQYYLIKQEVRQKKQ